MSPRHTLQDGRGPRVGQVSTTLAALQKPARGAIAMGSAVEAKETACRFANGTNGLVM